MTDLLPRTCYSDLCSLEQVQQCSTDQQCLTAALKAIRSTSSKSRTDTVWVQRPGGLTLGLTWAEAELMLQDGMVIMMASICSSAGTKACRGFCRSGALPADTAEPSTAAEVSHRSVE